MGFESATAVPVGWKSKLARYVSRHTARLKSVTVSCEDPYGLGQWLQQQKTLAKTQPETQSLAARRAENRRAADQLVRKSDLRRRASDHVSLPSGSKRVQASAVVVFGLLNLK